MSFGISRGKPIDTSGVEIDPATFPPLPDDLLAHPEKAHLPIASWFPNAASPLHIEIGSGKATFLVQEAPLAPGVNFLGIEYEREFFAFGADRIRRGAIPNIKMLCVDAGDFLHWRVAPRSVACVHLYFPDPWPKTRHHKRRMVQDRFLIDCARVLIPGGELRIATDHGPYWQWMRDHIVRFIAPAADAPFEEVPFERPAGAREGELVGTNFERKYRKAPGSGGGGTEFFATTLRLRA